MEGQEEMLRDFSDVGLCNLLSTLKSIWDFRGACDKTTGHMSRIWKKINFICQENVDNIHWKKNYKCYYTIANLEMQTILTSLRYVPYRIIYNRGHYIGQKTAV